jgi:hypothetical protein
MHELYEALMEACEQYQAMQQEHLTCLASAAQADVERLVFERSQRFADLQNLLTRLRYQLNTTVLEPALLDALRARLSALHTGDAVLAERLHAYRATLAQQRAEVQQGQKALVGYGSLVTPLSPRVLDTAG